MADQEMASPMTALHRAPEQDKDVHRCFWDLECFLDRKDFYHQNYGDKAEQGHGSFKVYQHDAELWLT